MFGCIPYCAIPPQITIFSDSEQPVEAPGCARLTGGNLAEALDVSWRYLQQLEAGKEANPSLQILCGLKTALKCSWEDLLSGLP